jgi:hemoglobin
MNDDSIPSLYEWIGGSAALNRLMSRFYEVVRGDPLLAPIFEHMSAEHPAHVAAFLAEVFGGPTHYSERHGGHPHMIRQHLNRHLTQEQRQRWMFLLLKTADDLQLPDDPEFRSALVGYLEWGSQSSIRRRAQAWKKTPRCRSGGGAKSRVRIESRSCGIVCRRRALGRPMRMTKAIKGSAAATGLAHGDP